MWPRDCFLFFSFLFPSLPWLKTKLNAFVSSWGGGPLSPAESAEDCPVVRMPGHTCQGQIVSFTREIKMQVLHHCCVPGTSKGRLCAFVSEYTKGNTSLTKKRNVV